MTARAEQETTVTAGRDDLTVSIWSNNPVHVRRLRKDERVTQVSGDDFVGAFTVPREHFDPIRGFRRAKRELTDEQRAAAVERLAAARKSR